MPDDGTVVELAMSIYCILKDGGITRLGDTLPILPRAVEVGGWDAQKRGKIGYTRHC
jgi:hypothetical protein